MGIVIVGSPIAPTVDVFIGRAILPLTIRADSQSVASGSAAGMGFRRATDTNRNSNFKRFISKRVSTRNFFIDHKTGIVTLTAGWFLIYLSSVYCWVWRRIYSNVFEIYSKCKRFFPISSFFGSPSHDSVYLICNISMLWTGNADKCECIDTIRIGGYTLRCFLCKYLCTGRHSQHQHQRQHKRHDPLPNILHSVSSFCICLHRILSAICHGISIP